MRVFVRSGRLYFSFIAGVSFSFPFSVCPLIFFFPRLLLLAFLSFYVKSQSTQLRCTGRGRLSAAWNGSAAARGDAPGLGAGGSSPCWS